jgi:hypothetical protein
MALSEDDVDRAEHIVAEMIELLEEFDSIIRHAERRITYEQFKAYPKGHIAMALSNEHEYVGSNMFPLSDLVEKMRDELEPEEEDEDETA